MSNEAFKQNLGDVAHGYVDSLFCLGICRDSVSAKLRFCWIAITHRHSFDVDDDTIQKHLIEKCRRSNSEISSYCVKLMPFRHPAYCLMFKQK